MVFIFKSIKLMSFFVYLKKHDDEPGSFATVSLISLPFTQSLAGPLLFQVQFLRDDVSTQSCFVDKFHSLCIILKTKRRQVIKMVKSSL
jgi:hypothetical protein